MTMQKPLHLKCTICGEQVDLLASPRIDLVGMAHLEGWRAELGRSNDLEEAEVPGRVSTTQPSLLWLCPSCNARRWGKK